MNNETTVKFHKAWLALDELVNAWESDETAQDTFSAFIAQGGSWNSPSLDEVHAEFAQFIVWQNTPAARS